MGRDQVVSIGMQAMGMALKLGLPLLLVGLAVGLVVSVFQAVTQIQEQTLAFIPKILAMAAVMVIAGPWMMDEMLVYCRELYTSIPTMVGGP